LQDEDNAIQKMIKQESINFGIPNLRETKVQLQNETRIWVGFGLSIPRCFILINTDDDNKAFYVAPKIVGNKAVMDADGKVLIATTALPAPKSGWNEFKKFLNEQGVDKTLSPSPKDKSISGPDEQYIVIEVKSRDTYGMAFYSLFQGKDEIRRALEVCQRIEQDFAISMDCGEERP
jgi:hypothetical protein